MKPEVAELSVHHKKLTDLTAKTTSNRIKLALSFRILQIS